MKKIIFLIISSAIRFFIVKILRLRINSFYFLSVKESFTIFTYCPLEFS